MESLNLFQHMCIIYCHAAWYAKHVNIDKGRSNANDVNYKLVLPPHLSPRGRS